MSYAYNIIEGDNMEVKNPLYKNIGIHVVNSIFTVDNGVVKILLIKRTNEPYNDYWALPSGALYNNELVIDGAKRELEEKTGINKIDLKMYKVFDELDRSPVQRMIAIAYIGVLDKQKANLVTQTRKTSDSDWFDIEKVPTLAYDHNNILNHAICELKDMIVSTDILKSLFPMEFTLPELHNVYESILNITIDRRNFRKKMINSGIIYDTMKSVNYKGKKPAKLYRFNEKIENTSIF